MRWDGIGNFETVPLSASIHRTAAFYLVVSEIIHVPPAGKRTVALSEYGGIAWPMPGHEAPGRTYGYGTAKSRAYLTARCKKLQLGTVLPQLKKGLSALVYTQLTDVEDEVNGLFTYDRTEIKPDANAVRSVNAALAAEFAKVTR